MRGVETVGSHLPLQVDSDDRARFAGRLPGVCDVHLAQLGVDDDALRCEKVARVRNPVILERGKPPRGK